MKANETPNEKNRRLLKQRFGNENETKNEFNFKFETDFGNEPITIKVKDLDGNENEHQIEKISGNGNETTLHFKNEPKNELGNENETGNEPRFENELHFRNELEMNHEYENTSKNENRFKNELITTMKSEILFYSPTLEFQDIPSHQQPKDNTTRIIAVNKENVFHLYLRYRDTVKIYLEKEYLTDDEIEDFKQASQRYNMLQELNSEFTIKEAIKDMDKTGSIITHDCSNNTTETESVSLSQIASDFLHQISERIHK